MKIAMLAYHFPPDPAVGSVRPASWARWLAEDHDVVVITRGDAAGTGERHEGYRIVRTQPTSIRLLSSIQDRRVAARVQRGTTARPSAASPRRPSRRPSGIMTYRMPCLYDAWGPTAYRAVRRECPDLVIGTHSPYIDLLVAATYASRHRHVATWLDYRDMWTFGHATTGMPGLSSLETRLERWALRHADLVTSCSQGFCGRLQAAAPAADTRLIYNSPGIPDTEEQGSAADRPPSRITLAYTGNVYSWQDVTPLWRLLGDVVSSHGLTPRDVTVDVASRLPGTMLSSAADHGLSAFVRYRGAVSRGCSMEMQRRSDILLLMESSDPEADGVLHAKVFEYLATDRPILLLGSAPGSELYRLVESHGRLMTLADLRSVLTSGARVPCCSAVDFAAVAKQQLLACVATLQGKRRARVA
jgi:hypothetical protein